MRLSNLLCKTESAPDLEQQRSAASTEENGQRLELVGLTEHKLGNEVSDLLFYYELRSEIRKLVGVSVASCYLKSNLTRQMTQTYDSFVKDLVKMLFEAIVRHEKWEIDILKLILSSSSHGYLKVSQKSKDTEFRFESLRQEVGAILGKANSEWERLQITNLDETCHKTLEDLSNLLHDQFEKRREYFEYRLMGVWHVFLTRNKFASNGLRDMREGVFSGFFMKLLAFIFSLWFPVYILLCVNDGLSIGSYIIFGFTGLFCLLLLLSWSSGQLLYYLCSLHPLRWKQYKVAAQAMKVARAEWPTILFGSDPTWGSMYRWYKRFRREKWDPWAQPAIAFSVIEDCRWFDTPFLVQK
ncbi:hypothetical protein PUMCH_001281 [Australozyma saopauloensis]|uniref:Uncharacterized protein n=1 Tax=Australozyma saopauloensis TaxID=291208 RepID=A0AAX4H7T1_9ASCO|nr:hypothetical protein PUMCH_001281 [[Candida] saopauloensis]